MSEGVGERCGQCGAALLPGRRYCVACLAQVPVARGAAEDRLTELMREIPSTHRRDKTMVFVPELREARLKRERRNREAFIAAMIGCVVLAVVGFAVWRAHERNRRRRNRCGASRWRDASLIFTPRPSRPFTPISTGTPPRQKALPRSSDNPHPWPAGAARTSKAITRWIPGAPITSITSSMTGRVISFLPMGRRENRPGALFCRSIRERPDQSNREDRSGRGSNGGFSDLAASRAGDVEGAAQTAERQHSHTPGQDQFRPAAVADRTEQSFKRRLTDAKSARRDRHRVCHHAQQREQAYSERLRVRYESFRGGAHHAEQRQMPDH